VLPRCGVVSWGLSLRWLDVEPGVRVGSCAGSPRRRGP